MIRIIYPNFQFYYKNSIVRMKQIEVLELEAQAESRNMNKAEIPIPEDLENSNLDNLKADYDDNHGLLYALEEEPPFYITILMSFQHYITMASSTISTPVLLAPVLCLPLDDVNMANLCSTIMFVAGINTCLQTTIGTRLPIIQGTSFAFLVPTIAILKAKFPCPENINELNKDEITELWQIRIREIQGAIIVASFVEILLGLFGIVGVILKYITPLTVCSAITMIGLSLFKMSAKSASECWWVALLTIFLIITFSQYSKRVRLNLPNMNKNSKLKGLPVLEIFPVLLAMVLVWTLCWVLTITDVFPEGSPARTDIKTKIIEQSSWIQVPYPFQWGLPTVTLGSVLGIICAVLTGTVESIGDYIACSEIVGSTRPPTHAMNRGIFMEGFGVLLCGLFGTGTGTTSYSSSIGALALTRVGSRSVVQGAGLFMIIFGMVGKLGAVFVTIPEPIIGGAFCVLFASIMGVGLSNLGDVDLKSQRNLFIIGFSLFFSLTVTEWVDSNRGSIVTGYDSLDQITLILLSTAMFVSGVTGFILDNTIPGTAQERGLIAWTSHLCKRYDENGQTQREESYDFPKGMNTIKKYKILERLPISPTFNS